MKIRSPCKKTYIKHKNERKRTMRMSLETFSLKELFTPAVGIISFLNSIAGTTLHILFGAQNLIWVGIYAALILADWISGTAAAKKDNSYGSQYGIEGIGRTVFLLLIVAITSWIDKGLETNGILFFFIIGGLIYHTFKSVTANIARAGWEKWIPASMLESLASEIQNKQLRSQARNPFEQEQTQDKQQ
ncbi:hypothetical protein CHH83_05985 [Bacillus sp. 7586-K]|nr:hypothetical protein CHH83_05985 [Bacillus sp. 7586-K]